MNKSLFSVIVLLLSVTFSSFSQDAEREQLAGRLAGHVAILASDSMEGRGLGTRGKVLAKNYIASQFEQIGLKPMGEDYFHHFAMRIGLAWVPATNVVGYLEGSDPDLRSEYIVLGAHYDHLGYVLSNEEKIIYPGADDNASGTAAIIELARFFAANPEKIGRSIVFVAFDAEESGLVGAERFISENSVFEVSDFRAMFSFDMVGMYDNNGGVDLRGMESMVNGGRLAREYANIHNINLQRVTVELEARTDTRPFGQRGIPAVHVFTGLGSPYHQPEDTYDLLDYDGMAIIVGFMGDVIAALSFKDEIVASPQFARTQDVSRATFSFGLLTHLGQSSHLYPDEFFKAKPVFGFGGGVFMQLHASPKISLQTELFYDINGSQSPAGTYRRHSLTAPLSIQYNLFAEQGIARVYGLAGGYFQYHLSGTDGDESLDFEGVHPVSEWGFQFGFGMDIMRVHFAAVGRRGLTNLSMNPNSETYTSAFFITLGYKF